MESFLWVDLASGDFSLENADIDMAISMSDSEDFINDELEETLSNWLKNSEIDVKDSDPLNFQVICVNN